MKLDTYQELALRTWKKQDPKLAMLNAALGLGESGEVQDLVKKWFFHGHELNEKEIVLELGDQLYYIAVLSAELGLDLSEVAERNVLKLQSRYPDGFDQERSINRED